MSKKESSAVEGIGEWVIATIFVGFAIVGGFFVSGWILQFGGWVWDLEGRISTLEKSPKVLHFYSQDFDCTKAISYIDCITSK